MQLFYHPHIDSDITLDETESHHCIRVLRKKTGDKIILIDGRGNRYEGAIAKDDPRACEIANIEITQSVKQPPYLHLAIAPTKNSDRLEWMVEKVTEIGLSEITFIESANSERSRIRKVRMEKKMISALKQSRGLWLPRLNDVAAFEEFIRYPLTGQKFIAHLGDKTQPLVDHTGKAGKGKIILIGPEGDFTSDEVKAAIDAGFLPVSLGQNVLRTETAGLVACTLLSVTSEVNR